jgi:hypothetical protein
MKALTVAIASLLLAGCLLLLATCAPGAKTTNNIYVAADDDGSPTADDDATIDDDAADDDNDAADDDDDDDDNDDNDDDDDDSGPTCQSLYDAFCTKCGLGIVGCTEAQFVSACENNQVPYGVTQQLGQCIYYAGSSCQIMSNCFVALVQEGIAGPPSDCTPG